MVISESRSFPRDTRIPRFGSYGARSEPWNKDREHGKHLRTLISDTRIELRQHKPVSSSLVGFVQELLPETGVYPQVNLAGDLVEQLKQNFSNNNTFIPLLQTFNVLLEGGALDSLNGNAKGEKQ